MEDETGKPKPHLRLAVENDQKTIDQAWAKEAVGWPLRELAANIIRVVRGAGKSYEIAGQCVSVIKAFQQYRDTVGQWPSSWEIDQALSISREMHGQQTYDEAWQREQARDTVIRGALQVSASRLVGQNTQEQRGRSEMMDGLRELEQIREETRKRAAEEEKARRLSLKARASPSKKRGKRKTLTPRKKPDPDVSF
ncbi:MAG: hypothetical protein EOR04_33105 [Mesorhizobium sp.]|uniref:hypothetical protein n=1 Tax=Mesorhizobium sp. TaxID=1871066 RepID=UPI000FE773C8|nr:hypothetical protein [Mesorhizobium sp.]RWP32227.1 MAG: hypothetical protein EOR04_33105 [Mesorhizobium sp.]